MPKNEHSNPLKDVSEVTFCLIKPMAVYSGVAPEIRAFLERNKFVTLAHKKLMLTDEIIKQLYRGQVVPEQNIMAMRGAAVMLELTRPDAIRVLRKLVGHDDPTQAPPGTLHYMYGANMAHNAVIAPKDRKEFEHMFEVLDMWFQVYTRAITDEEADPLGRADEKFRTMMGQRAGGAEADDEREQPNPEQEAPAAPHKEEEKQDDAIIEKVAESYAPSDPPDDHGLKPEPGV